MVDLFGSPYSLQKGFDGFALLEVTRLALLHDSGKQGDELVEINRRVVVEGQRPLVWVRRGAVWRHGRLWPGQS